MNPVARLRRIHAHLLLAVLALALARPALATNLLGTALVALGLMLRLWAAGVLEKGGGLCTDGPYRWVRHPLYLGSFFAALGFCVMVRTLWGWLVVLPLFVAVYAAQVALEERHLREQYGSAHAAWARQVPRLLPRWPSLPPRGRRWELRRALLNREHYHALVTSLLVCAFYLKRALLP